MCLYIKCQLSFHNCPYSWSNFQHFSAVQKLIETEVNFINVHFWRYQLYLLMYIRAHLKYIPSFSREGIYDFCGISQNESSTSLRSFRGILHGTGTADIVGLCWVCVWIYQQKRSFWLCLCCTAVEPQKLLFGFQSESL